MSKSRGRIYNKFYTEEKWNAVNEKNKEILVDFLEECKQQKKSKGTIYGYMQDLRIVFIYILEKKDNKYILDLKKKDFRSLSLWLSDKKEQSSSRVNRIKSALNSMLTFCEDDDDYDYEINYAKKVKGLKKEKIKNDEDDFFFTYEEFVKVRDILIERDMLMEAILWSIGFDSAGRRNELFQIKKDGLLNSNKTNIVKGKRGKLFPLVYLNDTKDLIKQYLDKRGEDDIDSLWYYTSKGVKYPYTDSEFIYNRIVKISDILSEIRGEKCEIFPHTLRHSRAECLLTGQDDRIKDQNGDNKVFTLDQIMVFMHHESVDTTKSYMKNKDEDIINAMFDF